MRFRILAAALTTFALAAACSSGDDSADETTIAETTAAPTTEAPTTTPAPATEPPATTTPTTTTPTTTTPPAPTTEAPTTTTTASADPTTTIDVEEDVTAFEAVVEAAEQSWVVYTTSLMDPSDDEAADAVAAAYTDRMVAGVMSIIVEYRENDYRLVESDTIPATHSVELSSVAVDPDEGTATVQTCVVNSFVQVQRTADGRDAVVDDSVVRRVEELALLRVDGVWKVNDVRVPDDSELLTTCE